MKPHTLARPSKETPRFYSTEEISSDEKIVYEHYFMAGTGIDYFVLEYDEESDEIFCWAEILPDCGELGYSSMKELESISVAIPVRTQFNTFEIQARIERDEHWERKTLSEALALRQKRSA